MNIFCESYIILFLLFYISKEPIMTYYLKHTSAAPRRACFKCGAAGLTEGCWSLRKTPIKSNNLR